MDYESFKEKFVEDLKDRLDDQGADVKVSVNTVNKLNESYEAVTVTPEGSNIGVNIGMHNFNSSYKNFDNGSMEIFIDKAVNPELETEIFVNANISHYPLRDYFGMWNTMANVVRDYEKIGKRNKKKDDLHLNKHAMHLIRLFMMALDILEKGEINTYREKEHDLLMDIRFGKYQKEDHTFRNEFYELLSDFEKRLYYAAENTASPEEPDMSKVQELVMTINERVVRDEI